jgi:ribosomal protein L37E
MADLVREARQEFWRPPQAEVAVNSALPDACRRCGTEFMVGAAFCHICGMGRHRSSASSVSNWIQWTSHLEFLKSLELTSLRKWFDLPAASLCSFLIGGAFLIVALAQGLRNTQEFPDFEAVQLLRIQWLISACAAFLVGILLKSRKSES